MAPALAAAPGELWPLVLALEDYPSSPWRRWRKNPGADGMDTALVDTLLAI